MKYFFFINALLLSLTSCTILPLQPSILSSVQVMNDETSLLVETPSIQSIRTTSIETIIPTNTTGITLTNTKKLLEEPIIYLINHSGDGPSGDDVCDIWNDQYALAIYKNGRAIKYYKEIGLFENIMNSSEIESLVNRIKNTGFQEINGDGTQYEKDPIYENLPETFGMGSGVIEIKVLEKKVFIYYPFLEYTIYPVRQTYNILNNFQLNNRKPYSPTKIALLIIRKDLSPYSFPVSITPIIWPSNLKPLTGGYYYDYEGEDIPIILSLFGIYYPTVKPVIYENQEYHVVACPRLE